MSTLTRRQFLHSLGISYGSTLITGIAGTLFSEMTYGQTAANREKFIVFITGQGFPNDKFRSSASFVPREHMGAKGGKDTTSFTWPSLFKSLEPFRRNAVLLDGLSNPLGSGTVHGSYNGALSCSRPGGGGEPVGSVPTGPTIDQFLAKGALGKGVALRSILLGVSSSQSKTVADTFAYGPNAPAPTVQSPAQLASQIFGNNAGSMMSESTNNPGQRFVFDAIRHDLKKLNRSLASSERQQLDSYLALVEDFEKRQAARTTIKCDKPGVRTGAPEVNLDTMMEMAAVALQCGLTNVVGISCGLNRNDHNSLPHYSSINIKNGKGTCLRQVGCVHDGYEKVIAKIHEVQTALLAKMLNRLSGSAGNLPAATTVLYASDRGLAGDNKVDHHAKEDRWGILVMSSHSKLKTGGRYIKYAPKRKLADAFCTLGTAMDQPMTKFGNSSGKLLSEILA